MERSRRETRIDICRIMALSAESRLKGVTAEDDAVPAFRAEGGFSISPDQAYMVKARHHVHQIDHRGKA
jgi:hypothetical protein